MDSQTNLYLRYYGAQLGGQLPSFQGARQTQYGAGLGGILRGLMRTVLPIAVRGAKTLFGATMKAKESGSTWKDALTSAIKPTALGVVEDAADEIEHRIRNRKRPLQAGAGRLPPVKRRKKSRRKVRRKGKRKQTGKNAVSRRRSGRLRRYKRGRRAKISNTGFLNF